MLSTTPYCETLALLQHFNKNSHIVQRAQYWKAIALKFGGFCETKSEEVRD